MWRKLVFDLQLQLFSSSKLTIGENNYSFILINTGPTGKFIYRSNKLSYLFAIIYRLQWCEYISEERTCLLEKAIHNLILCNSKNIYLPGNSPWANGHLTQEPCLVVNWNQRNQLGKLIFFYFSLWVQIRVHIITAFQKRKMNSQLFCSMLSSNIWFKLDPHMLNFTETYSSVDLKVVYNDIIMCQH